jgi:hypothetical protein
MIEYENDNDSSWRMDYGRRLDPAKNEKCFSKSDWSYIQGKYKTVLSGIRSNWTEGALDAYT